MREPVQAVGIARQLCEFPSLLQQFLQASQEAIDRQSPHACISLLPGVDYQNVNESWLVSTP